MQTFLLSHSFSDKPHYQNHFLIHGMKVRLPFITFWNSVGQMLAPRTSPAVSSWICLGALWLDPFLYTVYVENLVTVLTVPGCVHRLDLIQADLESKQKNTPWYSLRVEMDTCVPFTSYHTLCLAGDQLLCEALSEVVPLLSSILWGQTSLRRPLSEQGQLAHGDSLSAIQVFWLHQ